MWGQPRAVFEYRNPQQVEAHQAFLRRVTRELLAAREALDNLRAAAPSLGILQLESLTAETSNEPTRFPPSEIIKVIQSEHRDLVRDQDRAVRQLHRDLIDYEYHHRHLYRRWSSPDNYRNFISQRGWGVRHPRRIRPRQLPNFPIEIDN